MSVSGGTESQVNTHVLDVQERPSVTMLADGGWVVTWQSYGQDAAGDYGIYQQRYNPDGTLRGVETEVNTVVASTQDNPSVTALADGGWLVTFRSSDGSGMGIHQQRFDSNGSTVGGQTQVNSTIANHQDYPVVTALADGGWVVVWQSWFDVVNNDYGIFQQRYDSTGSLIGSETQVHTTSSGNQTVPSVAALEDGGWVVTWQSPDADGNGVYQQRYDSTGAAEGVEVRVNGTATGEQGTPVVTGLADGGWVVVWQSPDGNGNGLLQQRYDEDGTVVGSETQVNTYTTNEQINASVTALSDGGWVVTWQSWAQDGSAGGIYQQRYDSTGTAADSEIRVNTLATNSQEFPAVTALPDGGWVVTWQTQGRDGSGNAVFQKVYRIINDAPVGTSATLTTIENTAHSFDTADFGFSDTNSDSLSGVVITTLPMVGILRLDGTAVTAGQTISVADIVAGKLVWTPPANQDGAALTTIGFKVIDDGGTDYSGEDTDGTERFLTFDVTSPGTNPNPDQGKTLVGGNGDDHLAGTNWADTLIGRSGNDRLEGHGGADRIWGGDGNDLLQGGTGNDVLGGGAGSDSLSGGAGDDVLYGGKDNGADKLYGGSGHDVMWAGGGNDQLYGGNGNDTAGGGAGNDTVYGGGGDDRIYGGAGHDLVHGGAGHDKIWGGTGNDILTGGAGNDTFYFQKGAGKDRITDFTRGEDKLDLTALASRGKPLNFDDMTSESGPNGLLLTISGIQILLEGVNSLSRGDVIL